MPTMQVAVVTGEREIYSGEADMVIAPGVEGQLGILPEHAALLTALKMGGLRVKLGSAEDTIFVSGGFMEVYNNTVTVLADIAEQSYDIDEARAQTARQHAQELLRDEHDDDQRAQLNSQLERAATRLRILETTRRRGIRPIRSQSSTNE